MTIYSKSNLPSGFYVYAYLRKTGTPYYIGKGKNSRAWDPHRNSNKGIHTPTNLDRIIILEQNLTELGAFALERRIIKWYGRKDIDTGILRNRTDGGEGGTGQRGEVYSKTRKKNMSDARKRGISNGKIVSWNKGKSGLQPAWNKGISLSPEQKKNMGAPIGRIPWNKGKTGLQVAWNKGLKLGPAPNKGIPSSKKGLTYEEIYGIEVANELREKRKRQKIEYWKTKSN